MPSFRRSARFTALALTFAAARALPAQLFPGRGAYVDTVPYRHLAGLSPLHILFGSLAGDYEQAVKSDVSLGVGATYSGPGSILANVPAGGYDVDVSGKARYYFTRTAPSGGSVGLVGGFIYSRRPRRADVAAERPHASRPHARRHDRLQPVRRHREAGGVRHGIRREAPVRARRQRLRADHARVVHGAAVVRGGVLRPAPNVRAPPGAGRG